MMNMDEIVLLLTQALADRRQMPRIIGEFQREVWHGQVAGPPEFIEVLRDLAYDLDYIEPDPAPRLEDESYQGLDRAETEIRRVLARIRPS
jgi:hypothetical protein